MDLLTAYFIRGDAVVHRCVKCHNLDIYGGWQNHKAVLGKQRTLHCKKCKGDTIHEGYQTKLYWKCRSGKFAAPEWATSFTVECLSVNKKHLEATMAGKKSSYFHPKDNQELVEAKIVE